MLSSLIIALLYIALAILAGWIVTFLISRFVPEPTVVRIANVVIWVIVLVVVVVYVVLPLAGGLDAQLPSPS